MLNPKQPDHHTPKPRPYNSNIIIIESVARYIDASFLSRARSRPRSYIHRSNYYTRAREAPFRKCRDACARSTPILRDRGRSRLPRVYIIPLGSLSLSLFANERNEKKVGLIPRTWTGWDARAEMSWFYTWRTRLAPLYRWIRIFRCCFRAWLGRAVVVMSLSDADIYVRLFLYSADEKHLMYFYLRSSGRDYKIM